MTRYRARVSFYSSSGNHFNQNQEIDTTTFYNLNAADQGNFIVENIPDNPPAAAIPIRPAANVPQEALKTSTDKGVSEGPAKEEALAMGGEPLKAAPSRLAGMSWAEVQDLAVKQDDVAAQRHESLLAKIETGFEQLAEKVFGELHAIKHAVLKFVEGPAASYPPLPVPTPEAIGDTSGSAPASQEAPATNTGTTPKAGGDDAISSATSEPATGAVAEQPPTE